MGLGRAFRSTSIPCRAERTLEGETFGSDSCQAQSESGAHWGNTMHSPSFSLVLMPGRSSSVLPPASGSTFLFILNSNFRAADKAQLLPEELQLCRDLGAAEGQSLKDRGQTSQVTCSLYPCHPSMARKASLLTLLPLLAWHKTTAGQKSAQG